MRALRLAVRLAVILGALCGPGASVDTPAPARAAEKAAPREPPAATDEPTLNAEICGDACALLTRVDYDELVANACNLCKKHDDTFCEVDFPFSDVPSCEAYDELRNCIYARFGYVFSSPRWKERFEKLPWYRPDPSFTEAKLTPVARANVRKLKELKDGRKGCE